MGGPSPRITVAGGCGVGLSFRVGSFPAIGETVVAESLTTISGGKGANHAIGLARLGFAPAFISARGDDVFGRQVAATLTAHGVSDADVAVVEAPTLTGALLVDDDRDNMIVLARGALDSLTATEMGRHEATIAASDVLVVSLELPVDGAIAAMRMARTHGGRPILNLSPLPSSDSIGELLRLADVVVVNEVEGMAALGVVEPGDGGEIARGLVDRGPRVAVVTLGGRGAVAAEGDRVIKVPAAPVPRFVDSSGAGDAFLCGLVAGLTDGHPLEDALAIGCRLASLILGGPGFVEALASWPAGDRGAGLR